MAKWQEFKCKTVKTYSIVCVFILLVVLTPVEKAFASGPNGSGAGAGSGPNGFESGFGSSGGPGGQANAPALETENSMDVYSAYGAADVAVCKVVSGDYAGRARLFEFTIFFQDEDGQALPAGEKFDFEGSLIPGMGAAAPNGGVLELSAGGKASLFLKHGQTKIIKNVPAGAMIDIIEAENSYTTKHTESKDGPLIDGNETEFLPVGEGLFIRFVNAIEAPPPMGIGDENIKEALYLTAISILSCILIVRFVRRRTAKKQW